MDAWRRAWILMVLAVCLGALAVRASLTDRGPLAELPSVRGGDEAIPPDQPAASAQVRVLLGSAPRTDWSLKIDGRYRILADNWRVVGQGERLGTTTVRATETGLQIGERTFEERRLKIEIERSGTMWLSQRRYRGGLVLTRQSDGRVTAINNVEIEPYVASVINGEMPADFPPAARQALAIAARSYGLYQAKARGAARDFDLYDNTRSQVYRGMETIDAQGKRLAVETADSRRIAEQTRGVVLLYQGRLFCPYYGAVCGGYTGRGTDQFSDAAPPLVGVPCDGCRDAPRHRWQVEMPSAPVALRLEQYLTRTGRSIGAVESIAATDSADGRLAEVTVVGQHGSAALSSAKFREEVAGTGELYSPYYSLAWRPPMLMIEGRGWGHCVGLCQWGARGMAQSGSDCAAILAHYYPGSTLAVAK